MFGLESNASAMGIVSVVVEYAECWPGALPPPMQVSYLDVEKREFH